MPARKIGPLTKLFLICLASSSPFGARPASAQDEGHIAWYINSLNAVASGFKRVYCPAQPPSIKVKCDNTRIVVNRSLLTNAFASRSGGRDIITIYVGLAAMIDEMVQAEISSYEITRGSTCFDHWVKAMTVGLKTNTERNTLGLASTNAIPRIAQFGPRDPACRGVNVESVQNAIARNGKYYARSVEAGLATVLLHELGHVVYGHAANPPSSDEESRRDELQADDFVAPAAARAGQPISYSMEIIFMVATQGDSLDWERNADHPLGIRRAIRMFQGFRSQLISSEVLRRRLSPADRQDQIARLDGTISRLNSCLTRVENGGGC